MGNIAMDAISLAHDKKPTVPTPPKIKVFLLHAAAYRKWNYKFASPAVYKITLGYMNSKGESVHRFIAVFLQIG